MNWKRWTLSVAALALASAIASAQSTTEIKHGTVVAVWADQLVVKVDDGSTKQFTVPAGFQFDHEGKKVGLADLKPGWELTAAITTTKTPKTVQTTEIRNGTVVAVKGKTLYYTGDDGKNASWTPPAGFMFMVDGQPTALGDLKPNTKLTATIVRTSTTTEEKTSYKVAAKGEKKEAAPAAAAAPAPAPAPAPAAAPAAAPAPAPAAEPAKKKLPKTGSQMPLVGVLGAASLALGAGLTLRRKLS
jgi:LPXTG-motif cell wall-anchored protein